MSKILYIQTSGTDTPERLYGPFILATTAAAMDIEATIYFLMKGVMAVKKGVAEDIQLGGFPSLREVMDQAIAAGVKLYTCEQSCQLFGMDKGNFVDEATVVGAATLNDLALEADAILTF